MNWEPLPLPPLPLLAVPPLIWLPSSLGMCESFMTHRFPRSARAVTAASPVPYPTTFACLLLCCVTASASHYLCTSWYGSPVRTRRFFPYVRGRKYAIGFSSYSPPCFSSFVVGTPTSYTDAESDRVKKNESFPFSPTVPTANRFSLFSLFFGPLYRVHPPTRNLSS